MKKRKVVVAGASGYLGGEIYKSLKSNSELGDVISVSRHRGADYFCDLSSNSIQVPSLGKEDVVFFSAAVSSPDLCEDPFGAAYQTNVVGTIAFIETAVEAGARVIFFSSDTVYGEQKEPFDESLPANPLGGYAKMKSIVETHFANSELFKSIRLSYVFSKNDKFTKYLLCCEKEAEIFDPLIRSVIHIKDVLAGTLALAKQWNQTPHKYINFGGPESISRQTMFLHISDYKSLEFRHKLITPDEKFYQNRPKVIAMRSPVLEKLLHRPPRSLLEACQAEFGFSKFQ